MFWYNYWFTDYKYFLPLHQDKILRQFFFIYVNFGIFFPIHPLFNTYWYRVKDVKMNYDEDYNNKHFRFYNTPYDDSELGGIYKTRIRISCMYSSRIWILRWENWFILSFYCLRPKETNLVIKKIKRLLTIDSNLIIINKSKNFKLLKRLKFVLFYYYSHLYNTTSKYLF